MSDPLIPPPADQPAAPGPSVTPPPVAPEAAQPVYTQPAYAAAPPPASSRPGFVLGIVGLVLDFVPFLTLVGLILSIVGFVQSKNAGVKNTPALVGIILGAIFLVIQVIFWIVIGGLAAAGVAQIIEQCGEVGGTVENGVLVCN